MRIEFSGHTGDIYGMIHRLSKLLSVRGVKKRVAEALDTSQGYISDLASGKRRINEDHIEKISQALNIPAWHLFADPNEVFPEAYKELISAYLSLDEDDKRVVDKFMFPHKQPSPPANAALTPPPVTKKDSPKFSDVV